ncbi:MAG: response regulator transcription factor [Anaerolineae bacterium]|nr:response regulator transcription factor [Anaerolineae bacterium]
MTLSPSTTHAPPVRLQIVDDQLVVRLGLRTILESFDEFRVVGENADVGQAIEDYERIQPDVVIMDVRIGKGNGLEAARAIYSRHPDAKIIILSNYYDAELVRTAVEVGVSAYLLKTLSQQELFEVIYQVLDGKPYMDTEVIRVMMQSVAKPQQVGADLTYREREILSLLAQGLANADIARKLTISVATVKNHLNSAFSKLGVSSRTEAVFSR